MIKLAELSIIIVSFNTKELLRECLKSLGDRHEVIVVDNASGDGSPEMVEKDFPGVVLIKNEKNLGFARANNQGIKKAKGKYLLLLNSDAQVKSKALEELVKFGEENSGAGVVGARLVNPDGSVQPSVYHFPKLINALKDYWLGKKGAYEKYAPSGKKPVEVEAVTGAAMLIPRRTIEKVGFLDEKYFMYFEDLDYCLRVRKAGFKIYYLPEAEIIHHHGQSAAKVGSQAYSYLVESSKKYHGWLKYYLLTLIIWLGTRWRKSLAKK